MTTLGDLAAGQLFIGVPEVASLTGRDERTIRKAAEKGEIPARKVGARWLIPVAWVRQQASGSAAAPAEAAPGMDELADAIAGAVVERLARMFTRAADNGVGAGK